MLILILLCFCWQWFQGVTFNPMQLLKDSKTVCGFDLKQIRHHPDLKKEAMEHLIQLYSEGKIKPVIDQVYAFEEVSFTLTRQFQFQCQCSDSPCCSTVYSLRTVPTFVTVHTFCASGDTHVSFELCLLIQGYFCVVKN